MHYSAGRDTDTSKGHLELKNFSPMVTCFPELLFGALKKIFHLNAIKMENLKYHGKKYSHPL